jgi:hypothetical protein
VGSPIVVAEPQRRLAPPVITVAASRAGPPPALVVRARSRVWRAQIVCVAAGLVFGVFSMYVHHVVQGLVWDSRQSVLMAVLLMWLTVPTVIAVGIPDRKARGGLWAAYVAVVLALVAAGHGRVVIELAALLTLYVAVPGAFVLATAPRTLRGVAWLVAPALVALGLTSIVAFGPLAYLWYAAPLDRLQWELLALAATLPLLVVLYAAAVALAYSRKWAGDETLLIGQWWLILAMTHTVVLGVGGSIDALWALAPVVATALLPVLGVPWIRRPTPGERPARLLLLRTFGDRRRSTRLLRDLTVHWRWVGSIELITGPDLATELLEPHEFLDYVRGRLRRRFVRDDADLTRRLVELDLLPDLDGRYRVNELLCHDDTWRQTVEALVPKVDAVLIDLRGLTAERTGVVHEIERLVALVPLHRIVALTDATTNTQVLRLALDRAAALTPPGAPACDDPTPMLRIVHLTGRRADDLTGVLNAVGHAADPELRRVSEC